MDVVSARELDPAAGPSAVTIGFFDGVHRGHQAVIRRAVEVARERSLRAVVITFDRHPLQTLSPGKVPPLLTALRRKAELIEALGVELLVVLEFTEEVSRWSPEEFVERTLVGGLAAGHVVVGTNFTFGHRAAGNFEVLSDLGRQRGFAVEAMGMFKVDGRPVSSTSIRESLAEGDLTWPDRALGRRYVVDGTVVPGAGRGRALGFRTANLRTPDGILLPGRGVYAGRAAVGDRGWPAAINVGINPTFGGEPLHLEAHLLDFDGDLLGSVMAVEFWQRLRDEVPFDTPGELARQITADVERTRHIVATGAQRAV
ncbi:MAG TPA: bifunctional riboflavin kinase/FAD synthetase [Actinomycetota bacterium]|nr:bifunctional riboflavin kinase/FAD synthetase [Actinomycetota bacterium]